MSDGLQPSLLLISNSTNPGEGYLDHCAALLAKHFQGRSVAFVPYALADLDGYADRAESRFAELGVELRSVHRSNDPAREIRESGGVFVGGGNTFRLLARCRSLGLLAAIQDLVLGGSPYAGASAGSNLACPTIKTTNDMLALMSDAYEITPDFRMVLKAERAGVPPNVKLDGAYKFVDALMTLVPNGPPSLIGCNKLTVEGKVAFAAGVVFKGEVKVVNAGDELKTVAAGTYEDKTVEL